MSTLKYPQILTFLVLSCLFASGGTLPCLAQEGEHASGDVQTNEVSIGKVRIGFDGRYKVGSWTPVWVEVVGGRRPVSGRLELTVADADGVPARYLSRDEATSVSPGDTKTTLGYVKFGRPRGGLKVEISGDDGILATRTFLAGDLPTAQPTNCELIVSVGASLGVEEALRQRSGRRDDEPFSAPVVTAATDLPDRWWGYEGVDTVCWAGSEPELVHELTEPQLIALDTWVRLGGRLLLSVGRHGEALLGPGKRFARFSPGAFAGLVELRRTPELERFAGAAQALVTGDSAPLTICGLTELRIREESGEGSGAARRPTVVRFPLGLGQVVCVMFDLDAPPIAQWSGRPKLVAKLLAASAHPREEANTDRQLGQLTHVGFEDLGGQLRGALDQFTGVPLFSFSWVAALLVVYILLIGPADYFFLRHVAKRMELTWITLPLIVVAFGALAVFLAASWKGQEQQLNQVDLVDIDLESSLARGTSWANLYAPRTEEFDLAWRTDAPFDCSPPAALLSWHGLAGQGLGGMDGGQAAASLFHKPYSIDAGAGGDDRTSARLDGVPVQVSATKSFAVRWWTTAELPSAGKLTADADGRLQGELINPLQVALLDAVVFYESSAYKLRGQLAPGERLVLTSQSPVLHVERRLTQRRIVSSGETKAPWDAESFDIPRILEIMMFHEAAGGRNYTGLTHRQYSYTDLSEHLKTGRAVMLARAEQPAGTLLSDNHPVDETKSQHFTFYRLVYPVTKGTTRAR